MKNNTVDMSEWRANLQIVEDNFSNYFSTVEDVVTIPSDYWVFDNMLNDLYASPVGQYKNKHLVVIYEGDIAEIWYEEERLEHLNQYLIEQNNTLNVLVTAVRVNDIRTIYKLKSNIKLIVSFELLGIYYSSYPVTEVDHTKLYNFFCNRITYDRELVFKKIIDAELQSVGYISCIGDSRSIRTDLKIPIRNFKEPRYLQEIDEQCKLSIVMETYNSLDKIEYQPWGDWFCPTEKSLRSMQIPNISVLFVPKGALEIYSMIGLKLDNINLELSFIESTQCKIEFLLGLMKYGIVNLDKNKQIDIATHNKNVLKIYHDELNGKTYYESIHAKIINM